MTYSIVARHPDSGELGVAAQSHAFAVGALVPWVEPGVGAVATQSLPLLAYGPRCLAGLRDGREAQAALDDAAVGDDGRHARQVGVVGADGSAAALTGEGCIPVAAHHVGDGVAIQGNLLAGDEVVPAMVAAWDAGSGELADRLLNVLDAAQGAGGEVRGQQSAVLVVVGGERTDQPWDHQLVRLHVDDHETPLTELRRLRGLQRAYARLEQADELLAHGDLAGAVVGYGDASASAPQVGELSFWAAVSLFTAGEADQARDRFGRLVAAEPHWREVLARLAASDLFPDDLAELGR